MVSRHQVNLIITNDDTSSVVSSLKKEKRLKTLLVKFLDRYAENPQQVELWLNNEDDLQGGVVEESEKLTKLKSSLELFKAFLDTAKVHNESNVESFTDYLTNEEFIRFRTEFEKSEQAYQELNLSEVAPTIEETAETKLLKNEVSSIKNELNQLKQLVSNALTNNANNISSSNFSATSDSHVELHDGNKTFEKINENRVETEDLDSESLVYEEEDIVENDTSTDDGTIELSSDENSDSPDIDDIDEALDILEELDF